MLPPNPQHPVAGEKFASDLETCRQFLLAIANVELPDHLVPKGGASDLVQETLLTGYRSQNRFHGHTLAELRAWLRGILLNELASFRRRYAASCRNVARELPVEGVPSGSHPATTDEPSARLVRTERIAALTVAVDRLPEDARQVLVLRLEHQLGFREIGDRLGRTEEAARKLFSRALDQLRQATHEHTD
jgi:RNA polymerase sigma-70 factor (ECF subfamily)